MRTALLAALLLAPPAPLVLHGAHVLSPDGSAWLDGRDVLLVDGRIAAVAPPAELHAPPDAQVLDLSGLHVVPGLIDLHTHLLLHPYDEASWDDQVLKESLGLRTLRAAAAARATLEAGFTTIRDLGTEGAGYADVALRDAVAQGIIVGPHVVPVTRAIVATGCYGPSGFDPRWDVPQGAQEVTGADEMRRTVREQIARGAEWIKVYADYGRAGAPAAPAFTVEELRAAVDEAATAGLRVAAHASTDAGIRRALEAGVASIEHGTAATPDTLQLMAQRGAVLCPTLAASEAMARYGGWKRGDPESPRMQQDRELIRSARAAGVTIACGSDAGVFAHGDNARELELLVQCGLSPAEALRAATATAADVLRRADLGRIQAGARADLVVLRGDPLADVGDLRGPLLVVQDGRVVADRRAQPARR
ncbi:MAG TPA: amidohydrolase family protein [Planctomycetota bacterium]|nr:amidohydrolase family protein [Planctomycetota bacterium]